MSSIFIVIPTYNESGGLKSLIEKIFELRISNLKVMIVDDNSSDGTGKLADELAKSYPLEVIHRPKKMGLGTAYVQTFKKIIQRTEKEKPDYIIQMDADFSHDPAVIPQFLQRIKNCDLVLGSRYVRGGKIENWNWARRLVSYFGNLYVRLILGLPYKDLTGGYRCWKKEVLENLDLEKMSSLGYNFQIEMIYRAHQKGHKICEVPIIFTERRTGESKFNWRIILEAFWKVILLRLGHKNL